MDDITQFESRCFLTKKEIQPLEYNHKKFEISTKLECPPENIQTVHQVHGTEIVQAPQENLSQVEADGIYTLDQALPIGVKTADCLPILIRSRSQPFAAALHCGWRSLSGGIISKCFQLIENLEIDHSGLDIVFGPSIGLDRFEVGPEVYDSFSIFPEKVLSSDQLALSAIKKRKKYHLDLQKIAFFILKNHGCDLESIHILRSCSYENDDLWFSYRRDQGIKGHIYSWVIV